MLLLSPFVLLIAETTVSQLALFDYTLLRRLLLT